MNNNQLYPLSFIPLYKERIWGGNALETVLSRTLPDHNDPIGEAWELVDRDGDQSCVESGPLAGKTLGELVKSFGSSLLGSSCKNCDRFPLLVKLIDAKERLSLQVHPDKNACAIIGNGAEPKTEMWYIISAGPAGQILAGLSSRATKISLVDRLESGNHLEELLQTYASKPGDAFFIPSGTIHAIGQDNLLLEIQQNSDTTYRLSDWGRLDSNGNPRQLHIQNGIKSIDFTNKVSTRIAGAVDTASHNRKFETVICPYFQVFDLRLAGPWEDKTSNSFHLLSAINGPVKITWQDQIFKLTTGRTMLIPASCGNYTIQPDNIPNVTVIKTTL